MAHALTDLGRTDEARRMADRARAPSDTLLGDVRALGLAQTNALGGAGGRPAASGGQPPERALGTVLSPRCCSAR